MSRPGGQGVRRKARRAAVAVAAAVTVLGAAGALAGTVSGHHPAATFPAATFPAATFPAATFPAAVAAGPDARGIAGGGAAGAPARRVPAGGVPSAESPAGDSAVAGLPQRNPERPVAISAAQEASALRYMKAQEGKPYSLVNRFGPDNFDCSGLVWTALHQAGVPVPLRDSVVVTEIEWLARVPGARLITDARDLETGDIVAMPGADPVPTPFGPLGHIGIVGRGRGPGAVIVSAYDHAEGVNETTLRRNGGFAVAVRPEGGAGLGE